FQSGCADFIAYFLCYRQPKNMRRDFGASLLKRPNVDAARLLDCPDNYELPHRGKSINPPSCARKIGLCEPGEHTSRPNLASRDDVAHNQTLYTILEKPPRLTRFIESRPGHTLSDGPCRLSCLECWRSLAAVERVLPSSESNVGGRPPAAHPEKMNI